MDISSHKLQASEDAPQEVELLDDVGKKLMVILYNFVPKQTEFSSHRLVGHLID